MLKKPITYTNFNGEEVTRYFYFNLSKAELTLREVSSDGTFSESMKKIGESKKGSEILPEFIKILKWSYGVKSADGETFVKNEEVWTQFESSAAYSALIEEIIFDAGKMADFVNAIMPVDLVAKAQEKAAVDGFRPGAETLPASRREAIAQENTQPAVQDFGTPQFIQPDTIASPAEEDVFRQSTPREPEIQDFGQ